MRGLKASLCVLVVAVAVFSQTPVQRYGNLSVEGNRIIGDNGQAAQLRGMSFFWSQWSGEYWNSDVVSWLASDWKVDLVRAAMGVDESTEGAPAYLDDPQGNRQKVQTVVDKAIAKGLYVIIDWHDHNAHQHESQAIAFFEEMAREYGDEPNVIYEIYNEPQEVSWSGVVKPYAERVISAIRAIDPDNLILVGTPRWCQDVDVAAADPINATNIAYTLHFYAASHKASFRTKAQNALNNDVALFVSEFGTCEYNGDGYVDEAETNTWFSFLDQHKISWANWSVFDKDESASALKPGSSPNGGWSSADLTQSGTFIRNKLREYASGNGGQTYYDLSTSTTGSGTVTPAEGSYESNSSVTLSAEPAQGWVFDGWGGDASGSTDQV
ncbi:MAG: cellulase family glycosylhydrolase, partial [Chitinivibrionales bacterium]